MGRKTLAVIRGSTAGVSVTLSLYIARLFTLFVLAMIAALTGLVSFSISSIYCAVSPPSRMCRPVW